MDKELEPKAAAASAAGGGSQRQAAEGVDLATADPESVAAQIRAKLHDAFAPVELELVDESDQHRGHGGWRPGGATHFRLRLVSAAFAGQSRVARQRAVMSVLKDELAERVHALAMSVEAA